MKAYAFLWPSLRPERWRFAAAFALTPLVAAAGLVQPLLLKDALDGHVVAGVSEGLGRAALLYLGCVVSAFVLEACYTLLLASASEYSIYRLRKQLFTHLLSRAQRFYERQPTGQLMTRATSDVDALNVARPRPPGHDGHPDGDGDSGPAPHGPFAGPGAPPRGRD